LTLQHTMTTSVPDLTNACDGQTSVKFGVLFNAYKCTNIFEALVVILREKIIAFEGELLLQGVHDNVDNHQLHSSIVILQENC
uniref:Costars family protein ABRACL n=1 Tax=Oncorhynchus kisutch TaxID=8019 RepID=A0A8C7GKE9_ONCKI